MLLPYSNKDTAGTQMEMPGKPSTIDDLYALADGAGNTIASNLQLHLALQDATAEELTRWFREKRSSPQGHDLMEVYRTMSVMDALEARAREVDPMILVDRLKDALAFNSPGFGGLERLPTEEVGKFIDEIPERYRLQFLQWHLNSLEVGCSKLRENWALGSDPECLP